MKIRDKFYETLTIKQRIALALEATARGDDTEKEKLVKTCPKKTYTQNDDDFVQPIEKFFDMALAVECDIRENLLMYSLTRELEMEEGQVFLQRVSNLKEAWKQFASSYGIKEESIGQLKLPESDYMHIVRFALPEAETEVVNKYCNVWQSSL